MTIRITTACIFQFHEEIFHKYASNLENIHYSPEHNQQQTCLNIKEIQYLLIIRMKSKFKTLLIMIIQ